MTGRRAAPRLPATLLPRLLPGLLVTGLALTGVTVGTPPAVADETCSSDQTRYSEVDSYASQRLSLALGRTLATGRGVTVAVVDSGVEDGNAHFAGGAVASGRSFVPGASDPTGRDDAYGHGTGVAGIIAARPVEGSALIGVAPEATILPVQVFVAEDQSSQTVSVEQSPSTSRMAQGIRYAAQAGADVINVSMSTTAQDPDLRPLKAAVAFAVGRGAVVVASGGNQIYEGEPDGPRYPAAYPGVVGVAASDGSDAVIDEASIAGPQIDLHAPGQAVLTTYLAAGDCLVGQDQPYSSYAAAFVSGAAAQLIERFPNASAEEIVYRLTASADRLTPGSRDDELGWGMLQPYQAMTMTLDPSRVGPEYPGQAAPAAQEPAVRLEAVRSTGDPLVPARRAALWWGLGAVGVAALAFVLRPWLLRRVRQRG